MARPREFQPAEVIEKAMQLFWRQGYLGTSVQDLVDGTGVNRASLYATFQDKRSLFLEALSKYAEKVVPTRIEILERSGASLPQIREYFETVAADLVGPGGSWGCLMVNSAVELAADDPQIAAQVGAHLERLERAFATALTRAAQRGEIVDPARIPAYARFLMTTAQGLMVVGKANPDPQLLRDVVESALRALV